jgi:uncharacterized protein
MSLLNLVGLALSGALGAWVGRLLRLPIWPLTGAILGGAVFKLMVGIDGALPGWWTFVAQVAIGSAVGSRLGPTVLKDFRSILVPGAIAVLVIISAGIALGLALWSTGRIGLVEAVFGMVPGGVSEMVAATTSLDGDGALVAGMHLVRLVVMLVVLHALLRRIRRRGQRSEPSE